MGEPGAHVIAVGACRPTQREMDPALVARARLFRRLANGGRSSNQATSCWGCKKAASARITSSPSSARLLADPATAGRRSDTEVTIFKSLGLAVEDVTAAALAYRRAVERGVGQELAL